MLALPLSLVKGPTEVRFARPQLIQKLLAVVLCSEGHWRIFVC